MKPTRPQRATIDDVAGAAGVSKSAVSKVLNDAYGVSPEMRAKVNRAIEELGYRPKAGARAMRGRTYTVGVLLVDVHSPFAPVIVEGIQEELEATPFEVIFAASTGDEQRQRRSVETLIDRQVDGLIMVAPEVSQDWLVKIASQVPTIVIARHGGGPNYDTVVDDDVVGAELVVEHLTALGHRDICHIAPPAGPLKRPQIMAHAARTDGYVTAMRSRGLEPDVVYTAFTEDGGYQGAQTALSRPRRPTAIFAGADVAALGVLRAAHELGLRVPEDLAVVGYDNTRLSNLPQISLTSVDQSGSMTGATSARLLHERISGRTSPVLFSITPTLVARHTSSAPPA
ncbi:LacI family DNA-binding transcriptional regulator [Streptomyces sp. NPDC090106]|uniref:LacI family DNA-binding transcriptional regulator n=1 Tax=Streptomyces sp. NPDC090106 TaxID=3365946 RepID=UPI003801023D